MNPAIVSEGNTSLIEIQEQDKYAYLFETKQVEFFIWKSSMKKKLHILATFSHVKVLFYKKG